MGLKMGFGGSSSSYDNDSSSHRCRPTKTKYAYVDKLPNPNPNNYKVVRLEQCGSYFILELSYPDCTNYEGKKIMLYKGRIEDLFNQKIIDPHFSENKSFMSPIGRFEPTPFGWDLALKLTDILNREGKGITRAPC